MGPPKYKSNLKGISVREVGGVEVIITPQGLELIDRVGEGILSCAAYNGDDASKIPDEFKKQLIADSGKGIIYVPHFSDDILKFYKREKLRSFDLIETGIDQLEANYWINKNSRYHSPTPFFASIDVLCMEHIVDMMTCYNFIKLYPKKKKKTLAVIAKIEKRLFKNISTSSGADNFYIDYALFKKTGEIKINPFDQKHFVGSQHQRDERTIYLDQNYTLPGFS